jgi:hypothetical protein
MDDEDINILYPNRTAQKTLILAIDELGGLDALDAPFALRGICDKYPLLLGARGTKERRGVQFKVRDWKEHPDQYDEALLEALRTTALVPGIRPAPVARRPSSSNESSTAASSSRESVTMPRTPPRVRGKSRTPPASAKRAAQPEPPPAVDEEPPPPPLYYGKIPWLQNCVYFMLHSLTIAFVSFTDRELDVDIDHPEANDPLFIVPFTNHKREDGLMVKGYTARHETPYQADVTSNLYSLRIYPSLNAVLFTKPSTPYLLRRCKKAARHAAETQAALSDNVFIESYHDNLSASLISINDPTNERRRSMSYLCYFPSNVQITNSAYGDGSTGEEGEMVKVVAILAMTIQDSDGTIITEEGSQMWVLEWHIGVREVEPKYWEKDDDGVPPANDAASAVASTLNGLRRLSLQGPRT